jgi:hypothetical protein
MAATAYAELAAYSELLSGNRSALPDSIPESRVDELKTVLIKSWELFSEKERTQILTAPGLWITFRTLLRFGSDPEKAQVRAQLLKLAPQSSTGGGRAKSDITGNIIRHQVMLNIQQQTFNHYMWSRGFHSTIWGH